MTAAIIIAAVCLTSLGIMWWLAFKAPMGWEDSEGWHAGEPDEHANPDNFGQQ